MDVWLKGMDETALGLVAYAVTNDDALSGPACIRTAADLTM